MPIYKVGFIIKQRREELGYTQEELADGICSVPTLSRIENGDRMPTKNHLEMLLQRLGLSDAMLNTYVDENTLFLHELKFRIRQACILKHFDEANALLADYETMADMYSPLERQFVMLYSTLSSGSSYSDSEWLALFENAIRLTYPQYKDGNLPRILSYEEILILNNIAGCYQGRKEYDKAIKILTHIKNLYEMGTVNQEEVLRTQSLILYNLSKCLGLAGKYSECIAICDQAIRIARETGRCGELAQTLYNRAWALEKRGMSGDRLQAAETAKQAYYAAIVMGNTDMAIWYRAYIEKTFPEVELLSHC